MVIFSPICPMLRATRSAKDDPSVLSLATCSEDMFVVLTDSPPSFVMVKQVFARLSRILLNFSFLATKSVSQLSSTIAAFLSARRRPSRPCDVLRPCSFCALAQPWACACSFSHTSASAKLLLLSLRAFLQIEREYPVFFLKAAKSDLATAELAARLK